MSECQGIGIRVALGACVVACLGGSALGQRDRVTFEPVAREVLATNLVVDSVHFEALDVAALLAEDRVRALSGDIARFAVNKEVDYTPEVFGSIQVLGGGRVAWRLRIHCDGARNVNIGTLFEVPESMSMYLLDGTGRSMWGEFTSADNFEGEMWSPIVGGEVMEIYAEMDEGDWDRFASGFRVMYVNIGYRGFGAALADVAGHGEAGTRSDNCHTDVACAAADPWCEVLKGAAGYTISGFGACSGALMNNTAEDERPLFYTAFHCGMHSSPAQTRTYFNFQNSTCREPGSAASGGGGSCGPINSGGLGCDTDTIAGATVVATEQDADSVLMELGNGSAVPDSFEAVYLGWTATETPAAGTPAAPIAGIHHPGVEEKRIAFENDSIFRQNVMIQFAVDAWAVDYETGGLEGGSSGSPLLDPSHRVIGAATAVNSFANICNQSQWYGRLEQAWDDDAAFRMALDPVGSGTTEVLDFRRFYADTAPDLFGFELDSPSDGFGGVGTGATMDWNGACFSDSYRLIVSLSSSLVSPLVDEVVSAPTTEFVVPVGTYAYSTTYYWAVEATNAQGTTTTPTSSFTIVPPPVPGAFNIVSPLNGTTDVETGPVLDWEDSPLADDYLVEVDDSILFTSIDVSQIVLSSDLDLPDLTFAYGTQYFWRVTANNIEGSTASTPPFSGFTTSAGPPCACVGNLDGNCSTDVLDFGVFAANFGSSVAPNTSGDMDGDGDVDVLDFALFAADFGCTG